MLNIKKIQDIMRNDAGVNGDAQRIEQIVWILFLKLYDEYEKIWKLEAEVEYQTYTSIIPSPFSWDSWAKDNSDGRAKTGEDLLKFINTELFPSLKNLNITEQTPLNQRIVQQAFEDTNNYMKDGILLRQVVNEIDLIKIKQSREDQANLSLTYETFLKALQSAGNAGEFYTPRAITEFVMRILKPSLSDKIADLACGTGGFLISAYHYLESQCKTANDRVALNNAFYGIEKKSLPFILCATGFLINGLENPNLRHTNAFDTSFDDLSSAPKFDIIAMNPPYGSSEKKQIQEHFPKIYRSSETADLFMAIITERLSERGKAAVVLPDGFLFGNDTAKINLKKRLLEEFNLHLIVRLPAGVFAPYTSITTNLLFFDKSPQGTQQTWFYRLDMPEGIKSFGKTKAMKLEHFAPFWQWDKNRTTLEEAQGNFKAQVYSKQELEARNYNFDLCGFVSEEEEILEPFELIGQIKSERERLNTTLNSLMDKISDIIKENG
ncbi:class I SAM-dependent DNA methyltransferase [Campylobacter sp. MIT 21-1685]|uniref:class I SAM-dependent DNA methyltransferase n=1 Tax=unclassified Campylobacter TaxID=2593542 RepID=UPI00224B468F|nr:MULTISPECIES: class I SAM-dependent DNA methyltransferase [unclassified Campylobacter]MCX2683752.1 class I SAM-dependent DNA methyltransferase [Campylobacter sp. MIT 21-1684]MCX2752036.1 class I SAM-dependent DNA methyltransferase [Campylobacter sp. MIT 21-1682]MCX2808238.1 class I SAM-dependent DNA methyltransferase [Campylobacter sp. MIT 21-1685]